MKKVFAFVLLLAFMLAACEKKIVPDNDGNKDNDGEKVSVYETVYRINSDAVCCGVENPTENIPWLKELVSIYREGEEMRFPFTDTFMVFTNDTTGEERVVRVNYDDFTTVWLYTCDGSWLDAGHYSSDFIESAIETKAQEPPKPCYLCEEFFKTHTLIDTLAYYECKLVEK